MSRTRPYGRAFKITESDAKAYERVSRPRAYRPNPLGVTAMASVNGRGAYGRSVRAMAAGKTRAQQESRARSVMRNGESEMSRRAGFLKNTRGRRLRRNISVEADWQREERELKKTRAARAANIEQAAAERAAAAAASASGRKKKASTKMPKLSATEKKRRGKLRTERMQAYSAKLREFKKSDKLKSLPKEELEMKAKRSALRAVPLLPGEKFKGTTKKWVDPAEVRKRAAAKRIVGSKPKAKKAKKPPAPKPYERTYERVYLTDPSTGKRKLSWMYKDKGGRLRKIPQEAMYFPMTHKKAGKARKGGISEAKMLAARKSAADRILKEGDAFVANGTPRQRRAGKRTAAYNKARKEGKTIKAARAAAVRAVPLKAGDVFNAGLPKKKTAKKTVRKAAKKTAKKTARKTVRKAAKKTARRTVRKAAKKTARKTVRKAAKKTARKSTGWTKAKRQAAAKKAARTRKKNAKKTGSRKMRKNGSANTTLLRTKHPRVVRRTNIKRMSKRRYRRNGFMAKLIPVLKTGGLVAGGFIGHKLLTSAAVTHGFDKFFPTAGAALQTWKKPIVGGLLLAVVMPLTKKAAPKVATELVAGMAASWVQSLVVSALNQFNQPDLAASLSGYSNSRAYSLRGPMERHATSIMPRYAPVGAFQQAAAGYQQAAAGYLQAAAGTGEYFSANATGEYFAPNNLQGVGSYEGAGALAMQASQVEQDIDDGIRPDSDIDGLLDLAEAAAGLRGVGEFYAAVKQSDGRFREQRVGQSSQWIPSGPLWAGTDTVNDTQATSELSAGILSRDGGNGSLSS